MKTVNVKNLISSLMCTAILFCALRACAAPLDSQIPAKDQISKIETTLFGLNYPNDTDENRLKRIEEEVFGSPSKNKTSIQERINKLNSTLGLESLAEAKAMPEELYQNEDPNVNYPAVDMLELELLGKSYKSENIYKRLERLEGKVFGKAQKGDLAQRTDSLKAKISMAKPKSSLSNYQTGEYYRQTGPAEYVLDDNPTEEDIIAKARADAKQRAQRPDYNEYTYGGSDTALQIAGLENSLFRQTYSYDPMPVRLNRLERRIFQRDFASDDEYSRIERLQAAATAKKTAKYYDNNKFQKFASTGMQIGTFVLMLLALIL